MNRLMVKPMPPSIDTPRTCCQLLPAGLAASPQRTAAQRRPEYAGRLAHEETERDAERDGSNSLPNDMPASDTPALAKANRGITPNRTQGSMLCSRRCKGELLLALDEQRDRQRYHHTRQRRMHARLQHADPDEDADQHIGRDARDAQRIERRQHADAHGRQS